MCITVPMYSADFHSSQVHFLPANTGNLYGSFSFILPYFLLAFPSTFLLPLFLRHYVNNLVAVAAGVTVLTGRLQYWSNNTQRLTTFNTVLQEPAIAEISIRSPPFKEPEDSLTVFTAPAMWPYHVLVEFSRHPFYLHSLRSNLILSSHLRLGTHVVSFRFTVQFCALLIHSFIIWILCYFCFLGNTIYNYI
jgi:hypothetical protein